MGMRHKSPWFQGFWIGLGLILGGFVWMYSLPAEDAAWVVAEWSQQKILLANPVGTIWNGSAELGLANAQGDIQFWPKRIRWNLGLSKNGLELSGYDNAGGGPWVLDFGVQALTVQAGRVRWPARFLWGLGVPFTTLGIDGVMDTRWTATKLFYTPPVLRQSWRVEGTAQAVSARISSVNPLGDYRVKVEWGALGGVMNLETIQGPLLLSGQGRWQGNGFHFDGTASAVDNQINSLAGLLGILGQKQGNISHLSY